MLFDIKDLEFKKLVEAGDIHALEKLALKYSELGYWDLAGKYFMQILKSEEANDGKPCIQALIYLGVDAFHEGEIEKAYKCYKVAKDFMEKTLPEEEWRLIVHERLRQLKKMLRLLKKNNQQSYFELAKSYERNEFNFVTDYRIQDYAFCYYQKVIDKKCRINKSDYIYAHVFVASHHIEEGEPEEGLELLNKAKIFMEKKLSEEYWYMPLYEAIQLAKIRMLETDE